MQKILALTLVILRLLKSDSTLPAIVCPFPIVIARPNRRPFFGDKLGFTDSARHRA
jgi:hypothetical protein